MDAVAGALPGLGNLAGLSGLSGLTGLSALLNPQLASAAATLSTALGLAGATGSGLLSSPVMASAAIPPPGLAIPQLSFGASALARTASPGRLSNQPAVAIPPPAVVTPVLASPILSVGSNNIGTTAAARPPVVSPQEALQTIRKAQEVIYFMECKKSLFSVLI